MGSVDRLPERLIFRKAQKRLSLGRIQGGTRSKNIEDSPNTTVVVNDSVEKPIPQWAEKRMPRRELRRGQVASAEPGRPGPPLWSHQAVFEPGRGRRWHRPPAGLRAPARRRYTTLAPSRGEHARRGRPLIKAITRGREWFGELASGRTRSLQELGHVRRPSPGSADPFRHKSRRGTGRSLSRKDKYDREYRRDRGQVPKHLTLLDAAILSRIEGVAKKEPDAAY